MTTANPSVAVWARHPVGRIARITIAVGGLAMATVALISASLVSSGSWALVVLGVGLAASSVRAARLPTTTRLVLTAASLIGILLIYQAL